MGCRVVAQAYPPLHRTAFVPKPVNAVFVADKVALVQLFSPNYLSFPFELQLHKHSLLAFSHLS